MLINCTLIIMTSMIHEDMLRRDDMDFFDRPYYRLNKRLLFYLGLWPLQTRNERYFYGTTTILLFGSIFVPKLIKFVECFGDLNGMMQCVPWLAIDFRSFVKLINNNVKVTKIRSLTNRIKDDWTIKNGELDEAILTSYAERGKLLTLIYVVYMFSALTMYLCIPLIPIILDVVTPLNQSRDRIFLLQTEYFIDQNEIYFYSLIHAYITMPFALGIIIAYDTMYAVYVQHACGIFATLGARLQSIGSTGSNSRLETYNDPGKSKDKAYDDIVSCIKMHNEAVEIASLIESSSCISCLFVLGTSILTITVTGFMIVTNLDQPSEALRAVLVVIGELIHLFYICWQGQVLMEHNEDIFVDAYNVDWCDISPRAKKLLILIMVRSLKPCKLTAGKIFVLSMENFATALKTSASYFTVLLSMQ